MDNAQNIPGPWKANGTSVWSEYGCVAVGISSPGNANLIASAPDLAREVEQLRAENAQLRETLQKLDHLTR